MNNQKNTSKGFTLVELIVSLTITSVLMLGLSVFFSSTFHQLFQAQLTSSTIAREFAANEIARIKFTNLEDIVDFQTNQILIKNKVTKNQLPFSYIGTDGDHMVFKDLMIFNKVFYDGSKFYYGDSGKGKIYEINGSLSPIVEPPINFTGFAKIDSTYYVAVPEKNVIKICNPNCDSNLEFPNLALPLSHPTDVETDGINIYVSDSGNNRILKVEISSPNIVTSLADTNLNFPTGLAYSSSGHLFVADTYNHNIKRIESTFPFKIDTVIGDSENPTCNGTASFCKLNLPTGLFADNVNRALYISDSGKNRILKMFDPPESSELIDSPINFTLNSPEEISKIDFVFPATLAKISEDSPNSLHLGKFTLNNETLEYNLSVPIIQNYTINCDCSGGESPSCQQCFSGFNVKSENNIFQNNDSIVLESDNYTVESTFSDNIYVNEYQYLRVYAPGTLARVNNTFSSGDYQFNLDLSDPGNNFSIGFQSIATKVYDENGAILKEENTSLLLGDGELGTPEDQIEVVVEDLKFPTGIAITGNSIYFANSSEKKIKLYKTDSQTFNPDKATLTNYFITPLTTFDYTSDFKIDSLEFSKYNNDSILELKVDTKGQNYIISTPIPQ